MNGRVVASRVVRVGAAVAVAAAIARTAAACTMTPSLDFVVDAEGVGPSSDDAPDVSAATAADGAAEPSDAAANDAGAPGDAAAEAADDAADDAHRNNTCPDAAPPNVTQCCGRVRCVGKGCDDSRCGDCSLCAVSSVCCLKNAHAAAFCGANVAACK